MKTIPAPAPAPAPVADGMTQDQLDDIYARVLAAQRKARRVLDRAARLHLSMTELLSSPAAVAS